MQLHRLERAGERVRERGMRLHAGHGLNYRNVIAVARIPLMAELNIGHAIVSRAMFVGLREAVREMKRVLDAATAARDVRWVESLGRTGRAEGAGLWPTQGRTTGMFSGAMTAMVTPFKDGRLDEARLKEQVEFQITGGIDGLVPVGTTGESPTVDFKEHARVIELTVQFARGRVPVIAGTGGNATTEALELHQIAKRPAPRRACRSTPTTTSRRRRGCTATS